MKKYYILGTLMMMLAIPFASHAQEENKSDSTKPKKRVLHIGSDDDRDYTPRKPAKTYFTLAGDVGMLSFSKVEESGDQISSVPRFTAFLQLGLHYHINFSKKVGIFTGGDIKNLGFIAKDEPGVKVKRRVFTLGVPLAFKVGDMNGSNYFYFGGQYDLALNYKEKVFIDGKKSQKFNEWFSDRTPLLMPSVFVGYRFNQFFGLKVQYWPQNFMNQDFTLHKVPAGGVSQPYANYEARVGAVTVNWDFGSAVRTKIYTKYKQH
ncbi:hypothetical protein LX64_02966 [Chitinophaga skermanii]|uniref:Outer membrane protein with beta-barrel domain n=1 Tax=Chitinophaga skermanii TaxID=331697 RepID=A0A327QJC6_9BACT|nr:hypothetical protein [Chitinophaga skermanii]RAJ04088.1 hypothetical protein LX64_02966 [Chitinophaga skermanii]